MRRRTRGLSLLAAATIAGLIGADAAFAVGGGEVADGVYPFVAKVSYGDLHTCTGALVDPRWVVTAKSCFFPDSILRSDVQPVDPNTPRVPKRPTTVVLGRTDLTGVAGHRLAVQLLIPHPDRDLALAELSAPVTDIPPVSLGGTAPQAGELLRVAGYGRTAAEWVPDRLHADSFTVQSVDAASFQVLGAAAGSTICKGDAGGPAFREVQGGVELVGVNDTSWQKGCLGETETRDGAVETRTDDLADWVRASTAVQPNALGDPATGEFNRDGLQDLIAKDTDGNLWLYPGTQTPDRWGSRNRIGSGWAGYRELVVGRVNRDAYDDLVAIESATSKLWLYPGTAGGGGFGARVEIGSGWTSDFRDIAIGRVNRDAYDDLVVVKSSTQQLLLYAGNAAGGRFNEGVQIGSGWGCCKQLTLGRFNNDDFDDLLTVDSTGKLRIYAGTTAGTTFSAGVDTGAGTGWANRTELTAVRFGATGSHSLFSKDASGTLLLYTTTQTGGPNWTDPVRFGPRDVQAVTAAAVASRTVRAADAVPAALADEPPTDTNGGSIVEDFSYPGAAQILAQHGLTLSKGDGHVLFVTSRLIANGVQCDAGQIQVEMQSSTPPYGVWYCFRTVGTQGYLTLQVPGTFVVRGGNVPMQATVVPPPGEEQTTFDIPPNTPVPIYPGDGSEPPQAILVELRIA